MERKRSCGRLIRVQKELVNTISRKFARTPLSLKIDFGKFEDHREISIPSNKRIELFSLIEGENYIRKDFRGLLEVIYQKIT